MSRWWFWYKGPLLASVAILVVWVLAMLWAGGVIP